MAKYKVDIYQRGAGRGSEIVEALNGVEARKIVQSRYPSDYTARLGTQYVDTQRSSSGMTPASTPSIARTPVAPASPTRSSHPYADRYAAEQAQRAAEGTAVVAIGLGWWASRRAKKQAAQAERQALLAEQQEQQWHDDELRRQRKLNDYVDLLEERRMSDMKRDTLIAYRECLEETYHFEIAARAIKNHPNLDPMDAILEDYLFVNPDKALEALETHDPKYKENQAKHSETFRTKQLAAKRAWAATKPFDPGSSPFPLLELLEASLDIS